MCVERSEENVWIKYTHFSVRLLSLFYHKVSDRHRGRRIYKDIGTACKKKGGIFQHQTILFIYFSLHLSFSLFFSFSLSLLYFLLLLLLSHPFSFPQFLSVLYNVFIRPPNILQFFYYPFFYFYIHPRFITFLTCWNVIYKSYKRKVFCFLFN